MGNKDAAEVDRLRDNIATELQAQNALEELNLDDETIETLAWAIAANIHYAFDVTWAPKWNTASNSTGAAAPQTDVRRPNEPARASTDAKKLTAPSKRRERDDQPICVRCHRPVRKNASMYETYEKMHWVCFHYEFEHGGDLDPDQACADPACPARSFDAEPPSTWFDSRK